MGFGILTGSLVMLNTMLGNESNSFTKPSPEIMYTAVKYTFLTLLANGADFSWIVNVGFSFFASKLLQFSYRVNCCDIPSQLLQNYQWLLVCDQSLLHVRLNETIDRSRYDFFHVHIT